MKEAPIQHRLQFYETDEFLCQAVASFLAEGLSSGEPALVVATGAHWDGIAASLAERGFGPDMVRSAGRLIAVDARETLAQFMSEDDPDEARFKACIGDLLGQLAQVGPETRIRIYGEMVDLLWRDGNATAALRLECLWNDLLARRPIFLLCGYSLHNFDESGSASFQQVCDLHSHVVPAEGYTRAHGDEARAREVSLLQQRARALEVEVRHRRALEASLQETKQELREQVAGLTRLHEMSLRLSTTLELQPICEEVLATATALDATDMGQLCLWNDDHRRLEVGASLGFDSEVLTTITRESGGVGLSGICYTERRRLIVEDTETDPVFRPHVEIARRAGFRAVHSTPLLTPSGRSIGVLSTYFRTPRWPTERNIYWMDLCARQAVDSIENARLYAKLQEVDQRKDEFLATLAHELRNPLAPIHHAVQILRVPQIVVDDTQFATDVIERQVRQLVRLVDDLLDLSRITTGTLELKKERVEVRELLRAAMETSHPVIERHGHELILALPPNPMYVDADPTRLAQVVANLLNNAAKYTDRGGKIVLAANLRDGHAVITVRDTGIGIPKEMLDRVFDMFTQVEGSRGRSLGGLGIGLTLAKQVIHMHEGAISAESDGPGKGSTFRVCLPLASPVVEAAQRLADAGHVSMPRGRRILVVDDNVDATESLAMFLSFQGNEVQIAHDGAEAIRKAEEFRPDVILLDIGLPVMNGHDAGRWIRQLSWADRTTLIALSGWGQEADREKSRAAGFNHHLVKPVDLKALAQLLASIPLTPAASHLVGDRRGLRKVSGTNTPAS